MPRFDAIRVVLVDDHVALRERLATLLPRLGVEVLAIVGTAAEATDTLAQVPADVVLVDLALPDEDAPSLLWRLRAEWPTLKVIICTGEEGSDVLGAALKTGAHGYVAKAAGIEAVTDAIRAVHREAPRRHATVSGEIGL